MSEPAFPASPARPAGSARSAGPAGQVLAAPPASRLKPPSWLDGRLVVGVVLVLLSVVVGAKVVASSSNYDQVWAASRDLAPGTTITKSDVVAVKVRFHDHGGGYFSTSGSSLVGRTTVTALSAGQLIPTAALPATKPTPTRLVTVPVAKLHMPRGNDLQGTQVDLYVTVKSSTSDGPKTPQLVLAGVTVADTVSDSSLGGSTGSGVVLEVPLADVDAVVGAVESGSIDLVRVPSGQSVAAPSGAFTTPTAVASDGSA
ncbi:MAG: SAF domain-containing protein [Acidothermaceae bacterium]